MNAKPQLHQSMLNMNCRIQFLRRYGKRFGLWNKQEVFPPGIAFGIGSSVHRGVEVNMKSVVETGEMLPRCDVQDAAHDYFAKIWRKKMTLTADEKIDAKKTRGDAIDMTVGLVGLHYDKLAPELKPVAVEEKFVLKLDNYPFDLAGQIDLRCGSAEHYNEGETSIRDTKTAGMTPAQDAIRSIQFALYCLAHEVHHGRLPDKIYMDALVKNKKPKLVVLEAKPDMSWINPIYYRIKRFADLIVAQKEENEKGSGKLLFQPVAASGPTSWICSKKWCGYAETCEYWSGR